VHLVYRNILSIISLRCPRYSPVTDSLSDRDDKYLPKDQRIRDKVPSLNRLYHLIEKCSRTAAIQLEGRRLKVAIAYVHDSSFDDQPPGNLEEAIAAGAQRIFQIKKHESPRSEIKYVAVFFGSPDDAVLLWPAISATMPDTMRGDFHATSAILESLPQDSYVVFLPNDISAWQICQAA
jgi:hypothetical protein